MLGRVISKRLFYMQPWAKCLGQIEAIKENLPGTKNADICFGIIFDRYCQKVILTGETGH